MLWHVLTRAQTIQRASEVVLATSSSTRDDRLAWLAHDVGVRCVRGDEADVLGRFMVAAQETGATHVMRLTGDCPLLAPDVCDAVADLYESRRAEFDYASNDTTVTGYPDGTDVEVFGREALENADRYAESPADREHVTRWMTRHLRCVRLYCDDSLDVKLSVDRQVDLDRVRRVFGYLDDGALTYAATLKAVRRAGLMKETT